MTKRETFVTMLTMLAETYRQPLGDGAFEGYWMALEELTEQELKGAARRALKESKFMPSAAELLAFARPARNPAADVVLAWQAVRKAIDKYDYLVGSIDFGPLVNSVIRNLGGWDVMCRATLPELDNPGWLRKRFEEVYRALSTSEPTALNGEALAGALPPNYQNPIHAVVSSDGQPSRLRLEEPGAAEARKGITEHVRELANDKAAG